MEAAFGRFAPVARCIMQQTMNNTGKTVRSKSNRVFCHDWRVDEVVWIEIRRAQDFKNGATYLRAAGAGRVMPGSFLGSTPAGFSFSSPAGL